jgi:hypothetical protein
VCVCCVRGLQATVRCYECGAVAEWSDTWFWTCSSGWLRWGGWRWGGDGCMGIREGVWVTQHLWGVKITSHKKEG